MEQAVANAYFPRDENPARQARVLTHDEARRIAANIASLPSWYRPSALLWNDPSKRPAWDALMRPKVPALVWAPRRLAAFVTFPVGSSAQMPGPN